jgi:hypothetical protein
MCYTPKNRFVSIDPTTNDRPVAYRVEMVAAEDYPTAVGRSWWVGEPVCHDYPNGNPVPGAASCEGEGFFGWVAGLEATPVTREWTERPVHVTGCGLVPAVDYEIRASADGGASLSPAGLAIGTTDRPDGESQSWGDVTGGPVPGMPGLWLAPEGATNFGDVGNAIRTFEGRSDGTGAPPRVWVDVESNRVINLGDIQFIVNAFEGGSYAGLADLPFIGVHPSDCP